MTIITRSACEPGGICYKRRPLPPNVSHIEIPHQGAKPIYVTWDQILAARRERQRNRLYNLRICGVLERRAVRIVVRYFNQFPYGGWHTYIEAAGREGTGRGISHWIRRSCWDRENPYNLLTLFPLEETIPGNLGMTVPITDFETWMPAFAARYQRGVFHRRPRGVAYVWAICNGSRIEQITPRTQNQTHL